MMLLSEYRWFQATPQTAAQSTPKLLVRRLGLQDYEPLWKSMRYLVQHAEPERADEIWLLSHKPVFTLGQAGKSEHLLNPGDIPVLKIDRGGQVTYHGPGQLVIYLLLNMRRRGLSARNLVSLIESAVIASLKEYGVDSKNRPDAPGVYVNDAKIAALGLRIKNGWSYHGVSVNVNMDLEPFDRINPCGYPNLAVTQLADFAADKEQLLQRFSRVLCGELLCRLGYQPEH